MIDNIYARHKSFILYTIIGASGVSLNYLSFFVLIQFFGIHYQLANAISVTIGITNNFMLNKKLNFKVNDKILKRFLMFYAVGICGLIISSGLLFIFYRIFAINVYISKAMTLIFVLLTQYFLNKNISFKGFEDVRA